MAIKIRLSRGGAKKRPFYRIVVADSRSPRDGRFIERLGTYNPMVPKGHPERIVLKEDRIRHWLGHGAKPTDRVARFLGDANIIELPKRREQTKQNLPRAKTLERMKEMEEAAKADDQIIGWSEMLTKKLYGIWTKTGGVITELSDKDQAELQRRLSTVGEHVLKSQPGSLKMYKLMKKVAARHR